MSRSLLIFVMLFAALGCEPSHHQAAEPPPFRIPTPATWEMVQRSTVAVPGSSERVLITIDDITGEQVKDSASWADGQSVLGERFLRENESTTLTLAGENYRLRLLGFDNELIGEDRARFELTSPTDLGAAPGLSAELTEEAKIERLIASLDSRREARFVRNGREYGVDEAKAHLRTKWDAARDEITTAEQFIENVASRSSMSGDVYLIRMPGGGEMTAEAYFRERLAEIEAESGRD